MTDHPKPPLWRAMFDAAAPHNPPRKQCSAMICALADWLVPEELEVADGFGVIAQNERERLRQLLLAEADRAEAGE